MFWRISSLISAVYAVDVTEIYYSSSTCDASSKSGETSYESPTADTCDELQSELMSVCENDYGLGDCNVVIGACVTGSFPDALAGAQGLIFVCLESTDGPTPMPTQATCDDNLENGSEEGVDCGGDCPLSCPTDCQLYDCGSTHTLIASPENEFCAAYPCDSSDLDTCCDINALCTDIAAGVGCGSNSVLISAADATYCGSTQCDFNDRTQCCVDASSCENFSLCNDTTQYLRDNPDQLFCASEVCDESDIAKCCAPKAACSSLQCDLDSGYNNVANAENVYCAKNPCTDDDSSECCAPRASCATFTCDETMYLDKSDKSSLWCFESICVDSDWSYCCDRKDTCEDDFGAYSCGSTGNDLVDNPREVYCDGTVCSSPRDDDICCPPDGIPCNSDACSNLDQFFVDVAENCTSNPCTTSDTQCCIQRAQCSIDICDADTQVVSSNYCERELCISNDVTDCCLDRQSCGTYDCGDDHELIATALCETDSCDEDDIQNCCTQTAGSGSGTDGTIIAIAVVGGILVVVIIFGVVYKLKAGKGL